MNIYKWKTWSFSLMSAVTPIKSTMPLKYLQFQIAHILEYTDKRVHEHSAKESPNPYSSLKPVLIQLSNIYLRANIELQIKCITAESEYTAENFDEYTK